MSQEEAGNHRGRMANSCRPRGAGGSCHAMPHPAMRRSQEVNGPCHKVLEANEEMHFWALTSAALLICMLNYPRMILGYFTTIVE